MKSTRSAELCYELYSICLSSEVKVYKKANITVVFLK